jgi:hypothetical protein
MYLNSLPLMENREAMRESRLPSASFIGVNIRAPYLLSHFRSGSPGGPLQSFHISHLESFGSDYEQASSCVISRLDY